MARDGDKRPFRDIFDSDPDRHTEKDAHEDHLTYSDMGIIALCVVAMGLLYYYHASEDYQ